MSEFSQQFWPRPWTTSPPSPTDPVLTNPIDSVPYSHSAFEAPSSSLWHHSSEAPLRSSKNRGDLYLVKSCTCAHSNVDSFGGGRSSPPTSPTPHPALALLSCHPVVWESRGIPGMPAISETIDKFLSSEAQRRGRVGGGGFGSGFVIVCLSAYRTCGR